MKFAKAILTGAGAVVLAGLTIAQAHAQVTYTYNAAAENPGYTAYIAFYHTYANQFYVSPSGSDINAGTQDAPWATLAHADASAPACSVIWIEDGIYSGGSLPVVHAKVSGTSVCHRAFVALDYGAAFLQSPTNVTNGNVAGSVENNAEAVWSSGNYVDWVGFDVSTTSCHGIYADGSNAILAYNRAHDIDNATVPGQSGPVPCYDGGGLRFAQTGTQGGVMDRNVIWNTGYSGNTNMNGLHGSNQNQVFTSNLIYNSSGACISVYQYEENDVIANNTMAGCGTEGIALGADPPGCVGGVGSGLVVANNIIDADASSGNILTYCSSGSVSGTFTNNLNYGGGRLNFANGGTAVKTVSANPDLDYVASPASGGDFHLESGSPAIGAGIHTYAPTYDLDGKPRANPPSIGAYEYTLTQPAPPAPPADLTATGGNDRVALSWSVSSGASSYNVYRSGTSKTGYALLAGGITGTSYRDTSALNGTTYYYVVTAVDGAGESSYSNQASATPHKAR